MTTPQELKHIVSEGLLSFPVTDFDKNGDFHASTYAERLEWLAPYGATALFAAGGTGEFFSLTHDDYSNVVRTAAEVCKGKVPILAGAGGPTRVAIDYAKEAERHGANGILLDYQVARFFADAEALYSYEGTREMNTLIVGKAITGLSAFV